MTNATPGRAAARPSIDRPVKAAIAALFLAIAAAACGPGTAPTGTPGNSPGPTTGPTATPVPTTAGVEHPTGAKDVVLRIEESGGFVPIEWNATYAPSFTLYGDGTVVFRDPWAPGPETNNNIRLGVPFRSIKLDEPAIQALLEEALVRGGLAVAQGPYMCSCADIPTTTFTLNLGGQTKRVEVMGLSPEAHQQNKAIIAQLAAFAETLRTFGDRISNEAAYVPTAYRGVIIDVEQPFGPVIEWPFENLTAADFAGGENEFFKSAVLTPAHVEALEIAGIEGGMTGVIVNADGKLYSLAVRPLLPDETK